MVCMRRRAESDPQPSHPGLLARLSGRARVRQVRRVERLAGTPGFLELRERVLQLAAPAPGEDVLDVGAGTGLLTIPAAGAAEQVTAVDVSQAMCTRLSELVESAGLQNVTIVCADASRLPLSDRSFDLAISNYCLHHLDDAGKAQALAELARVLRPGGRLVIGDMMFRLSLGDARDRRLLEHFASRMLRRGPAGLWRLAKNVVKFLVAPSEHPADPEWWRAALVRAGFGAVEVTALEHEGGIARARLAAEPATSAASAEPAPPYAGGASSRSASASR
jgi:ubiquinone/menaquinone biosynthesis C-methylase UbiE